MTQRLYVELGASRYPIVIGNDLSETIRKTCVLRARRCQKFAVVTDAHVLAVHGTFIKAVFGDAPLFSLPPGEKTKSLQQLNQVYRFLAKHRLDRSSCIFAVGGGVIGDLVGFAAASFLRGIDFYQIPTTLLAAVDSSVGGKTGINLPQGKNLVGAFHQPRAVFIDTGLLKTLPEREFSSGMAEVIKYGMLADRKLFKKLEALSRLDAKHPELSAVIRTCCKIKAAIVKVDEQDRAQAGGRALLNLGHTFGHAIERVAGYGEYLHGEAVAIGLMLAAQLSQKMGGVEATEVRCIRNLLKRYKLPICLRKPLKLSALLNAMVHDKKVKQGKLHFIVMQSLGRAIVVEGVAEECIRALWLSAGAKNT